MKNEVILNIQRTSLTFDFLLCDNRLEGVASKFSTGLLSGRSWAQTPDC